MEKCLIIFFKLFTMSCIGGIAIFFLWFLRKILKGKVKQTIFYYGWSIVVFFLLVPVSIPNIFLYQVNKQNNLQQIKKEQNNLQDIEKIENTNKINLEIQDKIQKQLKLLESWNSDSKIEEESINSGESEADFFTLDKNEIEKQTGENKADFFTLDKNEIEKQTGENEADFFTLDKNEIEKQTEETNENLEDIPLELQQNLEDKTEKKQKINQISNYLVVFLMILWGCGCIYYFISLFIQTFKLKKVLKKGQIKEIDLNYKSIVEQQLLIEMKKLKMKRKPQIYYHNDISSPFISGKIIPKIYLPLNIDRNELTFILRHELIHCKRYDLLYRLLGDVCRIVHWFNPFVLKLPKYLEEDCELSCDELVINQMNEQEKKAYSKTILMTIYRARNRNTIGNVAFCKNQSFVERRVKEIMNKKKQSKIAVIVSLIVLVTLLGGGLNIFAAMQKYYPKKVDKTTANNNDNNTNSTKNTSVTNITENVSTTNNKINNTTQSANAASITGATNVIGSDNTTGNKGNNTTNKKKQYSKEFKNITKLKLHGYNGNVTIKEGSTFKVTADGLDSDYEIKQSKDTLTMAKKEENWKHLNAYYDGKYYYTDDGKKEVLTSEYNKDAIITIYIPKNMELLDVQIYSLDGETTIDTLNTEKFHLTTRLGKTIVKNIDAKESNIDSGLDSSVNFQDSSMGDLTVDTGSGTTTMTNIKAKPFHLDTGSGNVTIKGNIGGDAIIDSGSGNVNITTTEILDHYRFYFDTGSGTVLLNNKERSDGDYGSKTADYRWIIDSGSGNVNLQFNKTDSTTSKEVTDEPKKEIEPIKAKEPAKTKKPTKTTEPKTNSSDTLPKIETTGLPEIPKSRVIQTKSYDLNKIETIKLDLSYNNIHIYTTEDSKLKVVQSYPETNYYKYGKWTLEKKEIFEGKTLKDELLISTKKVERKNNARDWGTNIDIYLPKDYKKNIDFKTNLGEIKVNYPLTLDQVILETNLGEIWIDNNIYATKVNLIDNLGEIVIDGGIKAGSLDIVSNLGEITINGMLICNKIDLTASLGEVLFNNEISCETFKVDSSLGDCTIVYPVKCKTIDIRVGLGVLYYHTLDADNYSVIASNQVQKK